MFLSYLQELWVRDALHSSSALAQYVRNRISALRFVNLLHRSLVEQKDRDLLQANVFCPCRFYHAYVSRMAN
jgi:hypothetical protein